MRGSSVIRVVPKACSENLAQVMNKVNEIGRSVTVLREPRKQIFILNNENVTR